MGSPLWLRNGTTQMLWFRRDNGVRLGIAAGARAPLFGDSTTHIERVGEIVRNGSNTTFVIAPGSYYRFSGRESLGGPYVGYTVLPNHESIAKVIAHNVIANFV